MLRLGWDFPLYWPQITLVRLYKQTLNELEQFEPSKKRKLAIRHYLAHDELMHSVRGVLTHHLLAATGRPNYFMPKRRSKLVILKTFITASHTFVNVMVVPLARVALRSVSSWRSPELAIYVNFVQSMVMSWSHISRSRSMSDCIFSVAGVSSSPVSLTRTWLSSTL